MGKYCSRLFTRLTISALLAVLLIAAVVAPRLYDVGVETARATAIQQGFVLLNSASFVASTARGSLATAFGTNLATGTASAPPGTSPTTLAGTTVTIVDANGASVAAPLIFASPSQVNLLIPNQVAAGTAQISITNGAGVTQQITAQILNAAPGFYTATSNGQGLATGAVTYDEGRAYLSIINGDGTARQLIPGTPFRRTILSLFGTGVDNATNVTATVGGMTVNIKSNGTFVSPNYAGPAGAGVPGLSQVNIVLPPSLPGGPTPVTVSTDGVMSNTVQIIIAGQNPANQANALSITDVQTIISQAVARAQQLGVAATIAVTDREGNVLGVFQMNGAPPMVTITAGKPLDPDGLEGLMVPSMLAAISKAGTAAFFSTGVTPNTGSAISTRTAGFIVQEHFPPGTGFFEGGPLFGVQFSQLPCSDARLAALPLGLSADLGSAPIYKNNLAAGGVGIEFNGLYTLDQNAGDFDQDSEEMVARAATLNYEPPNTLRIDTVAVNGFTLPFLNVPQTGTGGPPFATINGVVGSVNPAFPIRATPPSRYMPIVLPGAANVPLKVDPRFGPIFKNATDAAITGGNALTATDVQNILAQAAVGAFRARAAIRTGRASYVEVNISVVDTNGVILGLVSTSDAPEFGFDVCVQKARTAAFFSSPNAGAQLAAAPDPNNPGGTLARFTNALAADGVLLNGQIAFGDRSFGFLNRPFLPDGIDTTPNGPGSKPIGVWSPFNVGLQLVLDLQALRNILGGAPQIGCTPIPTLTNGAQIFAGSVPLFRNGQLIGAVGVSGDGIDQDDLVAATGATGFFAPPGSQMTPPTCGMGLMAPCGMSADNFFVRGVRFPFVRYPRNPNL